MQQRHRQANEHEEAGRDNHVFMSNMKISTPLYEMDRPERVNDGDVWNSDGDRKYRLQSEGELFYVDTDLREDQVGSSRHDHDHHMGDLVGGLLGGVSLEDIRRSIEDRVVLGKGQQQEVVKPESLAETENASRSSSDSSADQCPQLHQEITTSVHSGTSDPINSSREVSTRVGYGFIDPPHRQQREEEQQRQTIQRDRKVQLDQISAFPEERGARERSFSEPHHLSRCTRATLAPHLLHSHCPPVSYAACPPSSIVTLRRRSSIAADEERFSSNGVHHRQQQRKKGEDFGKVLKKSLSCFGASKVEGVSRHLTSCTSTKTFEVLSGPAADGRGDQAILRRLGVLPDGWVGGGERGAITMTMHIAGHR